MSLSLHTHTLTLVASDWDELLSAGGEAVDTRSLYPGFGLGVVFKGTVHACGQVRNIPCLENQLEKQKNFERECEKSGFRSSKTKL